MTVETHTMPPLEQPRCPTCGSFDVRAADRFNWWEHPPICVVEAAVALANALFVNQSALTDASPSLREPAQRLIDAVARSPMADAIQRDRARPPCWTCGSRNTSVMALNYGEGVDERLCHDCHRRFLVPMAEGRQRPKPTGPERAPDPPPGRRRA